MSQDCCNVDDFRTRFPEFSDPVEYPDDRIALFCSDACLLVGECNLGSFTCVAIQYLTAHYLYLATKVTGGDQGAGVAPIKSATVDKVSKTNAIGDINSDNAYYASTPYGRKFLEYWNRRLRVGFFITGKGSGGCGC